MKVQFFKEEDGWSVWISPHEDEPIVREDACSLCIASEDTKAKAYSEAMTSLIATYSNLVREGGAS